MLYSKTVMDHFRNPRNVGVIENADGVGEVGNPLCGDMMTIYLKIVDDTIQDIKFQTFGCGSAIAVSSMLTEMAKGKSLDEAKQITNKDVAEALEGLPQNKLHCSNLGADALSAAITYIGINFSNILGTKHQGDIICYRSTHCQAIRTVTVAYAAYKRGDKGPNCMAKAFTFMFKKTSQCLFFA